MRQEKINLFVRSLSKSSKADYYRELVGVRLAELKYVIDSINPLELTTLEQVKDLIKEAQGKKARA